MLQEKSANDGSFWMPFDSYMEIFDGLTVVRDLI